MSKATKRERQRQNRDERRQREQAAQKRSSRFKTIRNFGIVVAIFAIIFVVVQLVNNNDSDSKKKSDATSTTAKKTTTTTAAPSTTAADGATTTAAAPASVGPQPAGSPPLSIDPNAKYTTTIETSEGTITTEMYAKDAPWGANNFVTLARKGFYDGLTFHRAAKDFVIQGGDPNGDGSGDAGYEFLSEVPTTDYKLGDLAYAKTSTAPAGSASSQFFVITSKQGLSTFNAKPYQYGDFGHVTSGLDVAQKIEGLAPASGDGPPTKKVTIKKITIDGPPPTNG